LHARPEAFFQRARLLSDALNSLSERLGSLSDALGSLSDGLGSLSDGLGFSRAVQSPAADGL
jgi:hypothetical protein